MSLLTSTRESVQLLKIDNQFRYMYMCICKPFCTSKRCRKFGGCFMKFFLLFVCHDVIVYFLKFSPFSLPSRVLRVGLNT